VERLNLKVFYIVFCLFFLANSIIIAWRYFQPTSLIVDQTVVVIFSLGPLYFWTFARPLKKVIKIDVIRNLIFFFFSLLFSVWMLCVPGTIERSRSLHIFQWVTYGQAPHTQNEIELALQEAYGSFDVEGFRIRLHEHKLRGLIVEDSKESLQLTRSGSFIFYSAKLTARVYNLKGWYEVPLR